MPTLYKFSCSFKYGLICMNDEQTGNKQELIMQLTSSNNTALTATGENKVITYEASSQTRIESDDIYIDSVIDNVTKAFDVENSSYEKLNNAKYSFLSVIYQASCKISSNAAASALLEKKARDHHSIQIRKSDFPGSILLKIVMPDTAKTKQRSRRHTYTKVLRNAVLKQIEAQDFDDWLKSNGIENAAKNSTSHTPISDTESYLRIYEDRANKIVKKEHLLLTDIKLKTGEYACMLTVDDEQNVYLIESSPAKEALSFMKKHIGKKYKNQQDNNNIKRDNNSDLEDIRTVLSGGEDNE